MIFWFCWNKIWCNSFVNLWLVYVIRSWMPGSPTLLLRITRKMPPRFSFNVWNYCVSFIASKLTYFMFVFSGKKVKIHSFNIHTLIRWKFSILGEEKPFFSQIWFRSTIFHILQILDHFVDYGLLCGRGKLFIDYFINHPKCMIISTYP